MRSKSRPWPVWSLAKDLRQMRPLLNLVADKTGLRYMALHWISITFYWFKISKDLLLCLMETHLHFLFHFAASLYTSRLTSQGQFFKIIGSEAYRVCCRVSAHLLIKGLPNPHIPWAPFVDLSQQLLVFVLWVIWAATPDFLRLRLYSFNLHAAPPLA